MITQEFCNGCKEADCCISMDGTCARTRHRKKTRPYKPSNSTEGECFEAHFCERCAKEGTIEHGPHCDIHFMAVMHETKDPGFPEEWIRDDKGVTRCTAFEKIQRFSAPYIIRNGSKIFFDAVFPVVYADGKRSVRGEGYHLDTGNTTIIPEIEFFIIRQLWPKKCFPSENMAMQALNPPQQASLF